MRRIRIDRKAAKARDDRDAVLPFDPRDPDVLRAKQRSRANRERV
jgi:hypothetical protein